MKRRLTLSFLLALLASFAPAATAQAHPDACGKPGESHDHAEEEICFSDGQIAAFDDSGVALQPGQTAASRNMHLLANLPKSGPFASEAAFGSDIAFWGDRAYMGNYEGFQIVDISEPESPELISQVTCPGAQNDISVWGNLVITSTDSSRNTSACEGNTFQTATRKDSWEGIRIFDASVPAQPRLVKAVETDCGSHTHTTIPDLENGRLVVYVSSYSPNRAFPDCQPPHDKISVVEVPLAAPADAEVVSEPVLFPDGGFPGVPGKTSATSGCHDITAYPAKGIAAGACMGEGVILDIEDLEQPKVLSSVTDPNFAFWHSATFTNDAASVLFTDELGGGGQPTCNPTVGPQKGADAIYDIGNRAEPAFRSYYKIPRTQKNTENCVAHNGNVLPTNDGRDVMVQAWYQGGTEVIDFTNPAKPAQVGFLDHGPLSNERAVLGGAWSSYFYNGFIYVNDIQRGLDVINLSDRARAGTRKLPYLNAQTQEPVPGT